MKIKNLNIKKNLKTTAVALVTGSMLLSTNVVKPMNVEASSITSSYSTLNYFTNTLQYNVDKYLGYSTSSDYLNKLLGYYDTLYDFINNNTKVQGTYFKNLSSYEQQELEYLLSTWGNEIYDKYSSKSYFKTNCKSKLGFYLKYNSQEYGYSIEHEDIMEYFTETQDKKIDTYLAKTNSEANLKSVLTIYKNLANFIKGSTKSYGSYFDELTLTEQADIARLIENWTYSIYEEYSNYSYYERVCKNNAGCVVNVENLNRELGTYLNNNYNYNYNYNYNQNMNYNYTTNNNQNSNAVVYTHDAVISYFTVNQANVYNTYINNHTDENLGKALNIYNTLWKFVKGDVKVYNYTYTNLTDAEKQTIQELIVKWSIEIPNVYGCDAIYIDTCTSILGWTLTLENYYANLDEVINKNVVTDVNNNDNIVENNTQTVTTPAPSINNTIGKDWRSNYYDPTTDRSRGVSDYTPDNINDLDNYYYNNYNNYGYYDNYGNFIPYNNYNQYNYYQDGYQEDYVPKYIR